MSTKLSRRDFLRAATWGSAGLLLVGCQTPAATTAPAEGSEAEPAAQEPITLKFHSRLGGQSDYFEEQGKIFEEEHGITIQHEPVPGGDAEYYPKLQALFATGQMGDVVWSSIGRSQYYFLAANAMLREIDDLVAGDNFDLGEYYDTAIEVLRLENKLYGLPWIIHPGRSGLMMNLDLFEQAGLEVPTLEWTYNDLLELSVALTQAPDQYGTSLSLGQSDDFLMYVPHAIAFGTHVLSPDGSQCILDSDQNMAALQYIYDFYHTHQAGPPPSAAKEGSWDMWKTGRLAMFQVGYWGRIAAAQVRESDNPFESAAILLPHGSTGNRGSMYENDPLAISSQTEHTGTSWELIKFYCNQENGVLAADVAAVPGGRPDVWAAPELMADPDHEVFRFSMEEATPFLGPNNFRGEEMNTVMSQIMTPIWNGDKTPEEQVPVAIEAIQGVLDKPRPDKL